MDRAEPKTETAGTSRSDSKSVGHCLASNGIRPPFTHTSSRCVRVSFEVARAGTGIDQPEPTASTLVCAATFKANSSHRDRNSYSGCDGRIRLSHRPYKPGVAGSNPARTTNCKQGSKSAYCKFKGPASTKGQPFLEFDMDDSRRETIIPHISPEESTLTAFQRKIHPIVICPEGSPSASVGGSRARVSPPPDKRAGATSIIVNIKGTSGLDAKSVTRGYSFSYEKYFYLLQRIIEI